MQCYKMTAIDGNITFVSTAGYKNMDVDKEGAAKGDRVPNFFGISIHCWNYESTTLENMYTCNLL